MHKTTTINTRIEPELKNQAETILKKVGLTSAEAVRLFYKQICLHKGLPFEIKIPNEKTLKAINEIEQKKAHKAKSIDQLFKDIDD